MRITFEINTGGAAFGETPEDRTAEVLRIVRESLTPLECRMLDNESSLRPLRDFNGNTVGEVSVELTPEEEA